ncbi:MAG: type II toxin-antitoxin system VapC family toxin [Candidatus Diapherotrites archaeon]|uniref:Ribonuclease VapC n=1 Tax=Candidatus Iainarchaeum sp. TaxID=3101447 RepID=A0A8T3YLX1_9ARCH|nr:type II toxin-antitoxin system VapC family toxin [Candidatus Diapherotrites archaeon]
MIGLDSTIIIDLFRGDMMAREAIANADEPLASTIINYQELMFGLDLDKKEHKEEGEFYDRLFDGIFLLDMTKQSAKKAAGVMKELQKTGVEAGRFDSMIAAILLESGVKRIMTRNARHFAKIKSLEVIRY